MNGAPINEENSETSAEELCCLDIVTQSDLVRYLLLEFQDQDSRDALENILSVPSIKVSFLNRWKLSSETKPYVVAVPRTFSALNSYRWLNLHGICSVAIVDEDHRLIANLSGSDLRGLTPNNLECLLDPVFEYLELKERCQGIYAQTNSDMSTQIPRLAKH